MKYELLEYELSHLEAHQTNLRDESVDLGMSEHILLVHPPEVVPFYLFFLQIIFDWQIQLIKKIYQQANIGDPSRI